MTADVLDATDRAIINALQGGFPVSEHPFADAAAPLGLTETALIGRIQSLKARGVLTRFGPLFKPEALGGEAILCAMAVPPERFEAVAAQVNAWPEVAHNYARDHAVLTLWFVVAAATPERAAAVCAEIEAAIGLAVIALPKLHEFHLDLRLSA